MKHMFSILFVLILSTPTFSAESLSTKVHNQYQSLRALGMGNAFTTVADDYSAMMYNPATLAKKKRGEIQFTLVGAGVAANTTKIMTDISDADKNAVGDTAKADAISNVLDQYYGKPLGARVQAIEFFWARPNWGIALIPLDLSIDMTVNRQLGPALDLNIKKDTTLAYGYAKEIHPNISAGILAKVIHRDSVEQAVSALELATNSNVLSQDRFKEGINTDLEIGFLWTPEFFQKTIVNEKPKVAEIKSATEAEKTSDDSTRAPQSAKVVKSETLSASGDLTEAAATSVDTTVAANSTSGDQTVAKVASADTTAAVVVEQKTEKSTPLTISFVARNLISSSFTKSTMVNKDAVYAPSSNPRVIDIGAGYNIVDWGDFKVLATVEAKNLLHPNTTVRKSTHAGFEVDYSPGTWFKTQVRAGINQMYFTAGVTLLLGVVEIDAVTYGEEVGTATTNVENRVTALKLGFNF